MHRINKLKWSQNLIWTICQLTVMMRSLLRKIKKLNSNSYTNLKSNIKIPIIVHQPSSSHSILLLRFSKLPTRCPITKKSASTINKPLSKSLTQITASTAVQLLQRMVAMIAACKNCLRKQTCSESTLLVMKILWSLRIQWTKASMMKMENKLGKKRVKLQWIQISSKTKIHGMN